MIIAYRLILTTYIIILNSGGSQRNLFQKDLIVKVNIIINLMAIKGIPQASVHF
jgi:hypothetical protein